MQTEIQFITIHNKQLRVKRVWQESGQNKPTLVFLHEGLGSLEMWRDFPDKLIAAMGLNAIIYERQGYGQSDPLELPRPVNYLEIEAQEWLPPLLEKLEIKNPILVGHSDGGSIALVYAALHPITAVIAMAAHVYVEPVTIEGIKKVVAQYDPNVMGKKLEKYHGSKTADTFSAWADTWLRPDFLDWNIESFLPQITAPALIIQGKDDEYASPAHVDSILDGIGQHATALMVDNCGHSPHLQAKEQVLNSIISFIQKI
ncbi:MAG: alpha/beta hydrolase [Aureispira sp.]|nr:alpha/beta hydrolase [Aureispira sp.]